MNRRTFCQSLAVFSATLSRPRLWSEPRNLAVTGNRVLLGVDYYPDQTPRELWEQDAAMMAQAGINNVRLAEFAWALMEPAEGDFHFEWLHEAVRLLHAHNIACILGTPSAAPPQWLPAKYPEVLLVNDQGVTMAPYSRRYTCPSNNTYRQLSDKITTKMAQAFATEPGVIGWQIDNEFTLASYPRCYCPSCRAGFQQWLKTRYSTLDALNAAWGTSFWSQVYTDFAQIPVPLPSPAPPNPGFALDYDRYQSDAYLAFEQRQLAILRATCPQHFITTNNVAGLADALNLRDLYRNLDFASADNYPAFGAMQMNVSDARAASLVSFSLDAMRWAKKGKPFLIMEEQSGKSGQPSFSAQPQQGQVRLWTYQAIAHGAMGVNYFRWDTARFGAEEYWHGLLNHDRSKSPAFDEIVQTIREIKQFDPGLLAAPVAADAAITFDPVCDWALAIQPEQTSLRYGSEVSGWYSALWAAHHALDCVDLTDDLSPYKIVFVPMQYVLTEAQARAATQYVQNGGTLVVGYSSGVKTTSNQIIDRARPGLLQEVTGITLADYVPLYAAKQAVRSAALLKNKDAACELWYDIVNPGKTEVLATYTEGDAAGRAAITRNHFGKGQAIYMGPRLGPADNALVLQALAAEAELQSAVEAPAGVEVVRRGSASRSWLFLLNHNAEQVSFPVTGRYRNIIAARDLSGTVTLPRFGVSVLASA